MQTPQASNLIDSYQRPVNYLRLSVTDRCNLRCRYCAPYSPKPIRKAQLLTLEEMYRVVEIGVRLGITNVRLTGGEPLYRRGIIDFIRSLGGLPGLRDISLTSNGTMIADQARSLKEAGLRRINISLDTLDRDKFQHLTGSDLFPQVWEGIVAAVDCGFHPIKINTVVMRGFNDNEIQQLAGLALRYPFHIRFIEYMPIGTDPLIARANFFPISEVEKEVCRLGKLIPVIGNGTGGPARRYRFEEGPGEIGFIGSMSSHFCGSCNRLRLTAAGYLRPCLLSDDQINLIDPIRQGATDGDLEALFFQALAHKKKEHQLSFTDGSGLHTRMVSIGG
jgi:GTP 3',8-cyclase